MAPKTKTIPAESSPNPNPNPNVPIKAKRGRKSKQELINLLNVESIVKDKKKESPSPNKEQINLNVNEKNDLNKSESSTTIYEAILNDDANDNSDEENTVVEKDNSSLLPSEPKIAKKRGRKPKGGKIIQQMSSNVPQKEEKPNVILHLKCSMKDLQLNSQSSNFMESYNFSGGKGNLTYELIGSENISKMNVFNDNNNNNNNSTSINSLENCLDCYDDDSVCKDSTKEIWKKLKQLEYNLHINNVNNKRSCCFWDTCEFDNPPIYIPKHFINGTYHVYGCFCSPECGVAYLMNENIDSSTKFERYHLFNHIYTKIYDYKKNIKPAPNPHYMLEKYYGNLSIQEYRSLLKNERLFLIVDKPLTRVLPELHEDNDEFILNNKIIPSNNYQMKTRLLKKKQNKSSILNEKFGASNNSALLE
jgi:hypothetical protein